MKTINEEVIKELIAALETKFGFFSFFTVKKAVQ